jgi:hypothetical protein
LTILYISIDGDNCSLPDPYPSRNYSIIWDSTTLASLLNSIKASSPGPDHNTRHWVEGDHVEIVTLVGGGALLQPPADKPLLVGRFRFQSRLFTGTGKFATYDLMRDCLAASRTVTSLEWAFHLVGAFGKFEICRHGSPIHPSHNGATNFQFVEESASRSNRLHVSALSSHSPLP